MKLGKSFFSKNNYSFLDFDPDSQEITFTACTKKETLSKEEAKLLLYSMLNSFISSEPGFIENYLKS